MTCYLRVHNILAAVRPKADLVDWQAVNEKWQNATSVIEPEQLLESMRLDEIDLYSMPETDLSPYIGLILSGRVDQEFLYKHRQVLKDFIDLGNVVVFSGDLDKSWLPGSAASLPISAREGEKIKVTFSDHPLLPGIDPYDVGNYFVSGHHPVPDGAEIIAKMENGEAAIYVDKVSSGGAIMVHAGHTLLGYAADARSDKLSKRLIPQLLEWIRQEAGK